MVTCPIGTVAAGGNTTFTVTVLVDAGVSPGQQVTNTAEVGSVTPDLNPANNTTSTVLAPPSEIEADLTVTKTPPVGAVVAGTEVDWKITVVNAGPSDAQAVVTTDTLPDGLTFVSADPDVCTATAQVITCELHTVASVAVVPIAITTLVGADVPAGSVLQNAVAVVSTTADPDPTNNESAATVAQPVTTSADISASKTAPAEIVAGTDVQWTIELANDGPSDAQDVVVSDTLPDGLSLVSSVPAGCTSDGLAVSCPVGTVHVGETATLVLTTLVDPFLPAGRELQNSAHAASTTDDPDPNNNASLSAAGPPAGVMADAFVDVDAEPDYVVAGEELTFAVTVGNNGPSGSIATGADVPVPLGTTLVQVGADLTPVAVPLAGGVFGSGARIGPLGIYRASRLAGLLQAATCAGGDPLACAVGDLAPDAAATLAVTVRVDAGVAPGTQIVLSASVFADTTDPVAPNNTDADVVTVVAAATPPTTSPPTTSTPSTTSPPPASTPPTTTPAPASTPPTTRAAGTLPSTGNNAGQLVALGAMLIAAGVTLTLAACLRRRATDAVRRGYVALATGPVA